MFRQKTKQKELFFTNQMAGGKIDTGLSVELRHQLQMIGLTLEDMQVLRALQPYVLENIEDIVDHFYKNLEKEPSLIHIITTNSSTDRLKKTLRRHITEMFAGEIDQAYVKKRHTIALVHVHIGLESKWYIAAFQDILSSLIDVIVEQIADRGEALKAIRSVTKIINLEEQLVLGAYEMETERQRQKVDEVKTNVRLNITHTAESLAAISEETHASVEELVAQSEEMVTLANRGSELSQTARKKAEAGEEEMGRLALKMNGITRAMEEMREDARKLNEIMNEMHDIINIVSGVAEQTNLLSLNASIEAARAGEAGRGFSVVAEEVRKLSDQTKAAVGDVVSLIKNTDEQVGQLMKTLDSIRDDVLIGNEFSQETKEHFDEIVDNMNDTDYQNNRMTEEITKFAESIHLIGTSVDEVAVSADKLQSLISELK